MIFENIKEPTLILDKSIAIANIKKMVEKAQKNNLIFRPHFKTHQSADIGEWFRRFGVDKITVSSVKMAKYFADAGWKNITIAFPLNIREITDIQELAKKIELNILISSVEHIEKINFIIKSQLNFFIKIDAGYNRAGILADDFTTIEKILNYSKNNKLLNFKGFLSHYGNTYSAENKQDVLKIFNNSNEKLKVLKQKYINSYPDLKISIGDTPSCSIADNFSGIDEIRPGNFIFYDLMQLNLGVCKYNNIAVKMLCPVIDKYPQRNEILIYGGAVHFSKEFIIDKNGIKNFGQIINLYKSEEKTSVKNTYIKNLSQEHGIVSAEKNAFNKIEIGDLLEIIPVHSCLSANLVKKYLSTDNITIQIMK
ncbi:MAG: alanine racemase [Bacteroidales bacterium]|nr:alanine racemase [Bacteroidales bacterium]MBN2757263.1 alanine racemase [Bacteroidales bacterium]